VSCYKPEAIRLSNSPFFTDSLRHRRTDRRMKARRVTRSGPDLVRFRFRAARFSAVGNDR